MVIKFNSAGNALLSKQTGIAMTQEIRQGLKRIEGIKFPQRVASYDIVEIGHNFNAEENNTRILTFRDKRGNIVQQNITKRSPDEVIETQRNHIPRENTVVIDPEAEELIDEDDSLFDENLLDVTGKKISTVVKRNGVFSSKSEEVVTKTIKPDGEPVVTISKIESYPFGFDRLEGETQSLYEYSKDGKKGYKIRDYGRSSDFGIEIIPSEETFVFENMPDLRDDKYFPLHLYSLKQFKRMAPYVASHPDHTIYPHYMVKWYYKPNNGIRLSYGYYDGDVHLNKLNNNDRFNVIKTSAHEKEHAYQRQIILEKPESEEAQEYINASLDSIVAKHTGDFSLYKGNLKERKAREAGRLAKCDYIASADRLKREFPYAPDYQIGYSYRDQDAERGFESIYDSFNWDT